MKIWLPILLAVASLAPLSTHAETKSCKLVRELAEELDCAMFSSRAVDPSASPTAGVSEGKDFVLTSSYGPSACKTGNALKDAIRDLKGECNDWLKERKADLKNKFQTGACNEECTECGPGLRKCSVKGTVHYAK